MLQDMKIWVGSSDDKKVCIYPKMANRHGLIAGATGTGKTVTLRVLAESFSSMGVPVFLADVKGDLAPMCRAGESVGSVADRVAKLGLEAEGFTFQSFPVNFWDIYGQKGMPLRTTISEMGPMLLARILDLNDIQSSILTILFKIADDEELLLIDTKDLKALIQYVGEHTKDFTLRYGNITTASLGAITRALVALESEGGEMFFGEPAINITDWFSTDMSGKGTIQILDCQTLINNPTMYSTFLLWMLSELFETLPEVGDLEKPRMVFFFDEAHMLFSNASKALLTKIEQVVKLIRSKGVGVYFITQSPKDIPDGVLAQLGNKIQHALHAYTPADQKGAKAAAQSFRDNPAFDTYDTLLALGTGQALVSVLDEKGVPTMVEKVSILPPQSSLGALDDGTRDQMIKANMLYLRYNESFDRDSAYEFIMRQMAYDEEQAEQARLEAEEAKQRAKEEAEAAKQQAREEAAALKAQERAEREAQKAKEKAEAAALKEKEREEKAAQRRKNQLIGGVASTAGGTVGREVGNSIGSAIGGKFGKKLGGNIGASLGRGVLGTFFKK